MPKLLETLEVQSFVRALQAARKAKQRARPGSGLGPQFSVAHAVADKDHWHGINCPDFACELNYLPSAETFAAS